MAIRTFVLTDQWKTPSMGDAEGTGSILRHGISGDVTLTPVVPPGLRVEDDPRAWAMLSRPLRASYHLGRLIGPDGRDGVRLLGWVDDQPVSWRVQRELRFNGERLPRLPAVTITPAVDVVHLPDAAPVDEADMEAIGQVLVDLGAVRAELAAAVDAAPRAEDAATRAEDAAAGIAADADRAVDAEQGAVAARDGAEAARDEASGMLAQKADLVGGVVPSSQIPAVAMTRPHVVADVAGLLALDVQEGDVGIIPDGPDRGSYMLGTGPATEIGSWKRLVTPESPVSSVNGQTGTVTLGAGDVGAATAGDVAAVDGRVSALESSRPTLAEVQARPAMWLWDGSGQWAAPPGAVDTDTVLNTSTGEVHAIVEVTA
ncbi:hypothetical protein FOB82_10610 [Corynebacterium xerosis]|uniref:Minor tail protein n=1 Tax=Corynebacterium xerosis TaxID=1725 RepID=A0A6B8TQT8_9CORY|nr:hypothetical protein [Corynebacterium xerosis]QGS35316.1 hypothetical protein FOB82_10610 [Corynebacterium xerosis]